MTNRRYPAIEAALREPTIVQAWTVDDLVKSMKAIQDSLRKLEANSTKLTDFNRRVDQTRQIAGLQTQFKRLNEQLNKLLGVAL